MDIWRSSSKPARFQAVMNKLRGMTIFSTKQDKEADRLTREQKRYVKGTQELYMCLRKWEAFTPGDWTADDLLVWIAENLPMSMAARILTDAGMERVKVLYAGKRAAILAEWALLRARAWEEFAAIRRSETVCLRDWWTYAPPEANVESMPVLTEHWWDMYIRYKREPQESDPRRRCAYLVAAGLLPQNFNEDDMIRFVASRICAPIADRHFVEWMLTPAGEARLARLNGRAD